MNLNLENQKPDIKISVRQTFNLDTDMEVDAFSKKNQYVPKIETLLLHWDFENVTGSDSNGQFVVNDLSSGSIKTASERYGWLGPILKNQHTGRGFGFTANKRAEVVDRNYLQAAKVKLPENT